VATFASQIGVFANQRKFGVFVMVKIGAGPTFGGVAILAFTAVTTFMHVVKLVA